MSWLTDTITLRRTEGGRTITNLRLPLLPLWPLLAIAAILLLPVVMLLAAGVWVYVLVQVSVAMFHTVRVSHGASVHVHRGGREFIFDLS